MPLLFCKRLSRSVTQSNRLTHGDKWADYAVSTGLVTQTPQAAQCLQISRAKARQRSIVEFANRITVACYKETARPAG